MNFLTIFLILQSLSDGGPAYAETNTDSWIVEPFNATSSLSYLVPALYWILKLKGRYKEFLFLSSCIPFLILGGIGSTLYHAFRSSAFLLYLDVLPILILTLMVSIYFWIKILPKFWHIIFILVPFFLLRYFIYTIFKTGIFMGQEVEMQRLINVSYFLSGTMIFLPALILMIKLKFQNALYLLLSCLLLILGLLFRELDSWKFSFLSMGTHWLWHISTAAGSWFLGKYLYSFREKEIEGVIT